MSFTVIKWLNNIILMGMLAAFCQILLPHRFSKWKQRILVFGITYFNMTVQLIHSDEYGFKLVVFIILLLAIVLLCFTGSLFNRILLAAAELFITSVSEILGMLPIFFAGIAEPVPYLMANPIQYLLISLNTDFCALVLWVLLTIVIRRQVLKLPTADIAILLIVTFDQAVVPVSYLLAYWTERKDAFTTGFVLILVAGIVTCAAVYWLIKRMGERSRLEAENAALAVQKQMMLEHYDAMRQQEDTIRRMRHDIMNHLQTVALMQQRGDSEEVKKYIEGLRAEYANIAPVDNCRNKIVDAVLYNKLSECQRLGIRTSVKVDIAESFPVEDLDLMRIFSNLMDNAINACRELGEQSERFLELTTKNNAGMFLIELTNSKSSEPRTQRAPDIASHGLGQKIVAEIAAKYDGVCDFTDRGDSYYASVMLRLNK